MNDSIILPNHRYKYVYDLPIHKLNEYDSHRRLFLYNKKGTSCEECKIECRRFILGKARGNHTHLDLYDQNLTVMLTVGHIIPRSKGGKYEIDNLRPLCHKCNNAEGNSLYRLCEDEELFNKFLFGKEVRRMSKNPFVNGLNINTIEKTYKDKKGMFRFSFKEGGTYDVDRVTFNI